MILTSLYLNERVVVVAFVADEGALGDEGLGEEIHGSHVAADVDPYGMGDVVPDLGNGAPHPAARLRPTAIGVKVQVTEIVSRRDPIGYLMK